MAQALETRNIIDHYHYWTTEAIKADLDSKRHNFSIFCCNLGNDFNIATVIRNANAFLAKNIYIYGRKKWDRRGAVGTYKYMNIHHIPENDELSYMELFDNPENEVVAIDNIPEAVNVNTFQWSSKKHTIMVLGQEQIGIAPNILSMCEKFVYIPQYGSVRSLNVGTASGIMMNDFCAKMV